MLYLLILQCFSAQEYEEPDYDSEDEKKELRSLIKSEFKKRKVSQINMQFMEVREHTVISISVMV